MIRRPALAARLDSPRVLGYLLIVPAAIILLGLLAYPLLLGIWLSLTSATIGNPGQFIGLQNYGGVPAWFRNIRLRPLSKRQPTLTGLEPITEVLTKPTTK